MHNNTILAFRNCRFPNSSSISDFYTNFHLGAKIAIEIQI